ncbi:MarR family winged helix-turn-helix transcriptional regulator [Sphingobacterium haloxyli]|uniref:MarR family transcriptional regulator n=1 Tax=Sphingobacterium haloxyli TaxID=2100533 RepID=A0A2S9J4Q9_9SPHI|nr:MarR family transcriptional regulator [Sphingobacterium haloxyli]PRD47740.1 MarR family transcriptional regulator [Sphingobacterium haloxyli]
MDAVKKVIENMQLLSFNVRHYFQKRFAALELDVTYEMVRVVLILSSQKYMNQQQIADVTFKNKASLTSLIDNLQKRGLVVRNEDSADRRNKIITLTAKGRELANIVQPVFDEMFDLLYKDVTAEELNVMGRVIAKMNRTIE